MNDLSRFNSTGTTTLVCQCFIGHTRKFQGNPIIKTKANALKPSAAWTDGLNGRGMDRVVEGWTVCKQYIPHKHSFKGV